MNDRPFADRVRERDLDNFLVEELHASPEFREWFVGRASLTFAAPADCEVRLQKSPPRLQDARQTDVQIGWFDAAGTLRAVVLIESKVTADFQPGQVEAYVAEAAEARSRLSRLGAAIVLVAPAARLAGLAGAEAFDARISIENIVDHLNGRRADDLPLELDARLAMRVQLLEALCGRRAASGWIATTVPEKRGFAEAYAALARERLPGLKVRPSTDGPKAITRIFEGLELPGLPTPALRHEFGSGVAWKWANAQFAGFADAVGRVTSSGVLSNTRFTAEPAGKSLAIRVPTPGIDPTASFEGQRGAVLAGLDAIGELAVWLTANASGLAALLFGGTEAARSGDTPAPAPDLKQVEREFVAALRDIYAQCDALGYRPTGMLQMIDRLGGIGTARRLLVLPPSDGFGRLAMLSRLDLAVESLVLEPRWYTVFTEEERRIARRRLGS